MRKPPEKLEPVQSKSKSKRQRKPRLKSAQPIQNKPDLIEKKIINGEGQKVCREILKGQGADIEMVPLIAAGQKEGKILMPMVFAKDLQRTTYLHINGKKVFHNKNHTIETVEAACHKMFNTLGLHVSIAAGRLLNQASFAPAYVHFFQERSKEGPFLTRQCERSQLDIDTEGEKVLLKIKFAFECLQVDEDMVPKTQNDAGKEFIGIEAQYIISKKELAELGALSPQELEKLDLEQIAPSAEAIYSYTKLLPNEEEAFQAIGIA